MLATLTLIYDGYFATIPEIDPYGADDVSPWRIPFVIANNSRLFSMQDVNIACELHFMELSNHLEFGDFALVADPPGQAILAGTKRNYNCPIEHVFDTPSAVVSKASISIVVSYKTLQWSREPITLTFTVRRTATGYEWLEGDPLY